MSHSSLAKNFRNLGLLVLGGLIGSTAYAQASVNYPNKPIKLIVAFPPGGTSDVMGRLVADELSKVLKQPIVVDNKAGAAGERSGATRPWAFGDTEPWDVTRTVTNAVLRTASEGRSTTGGVRLTIADDGVPFDPLTQPAFQAPASIDDTPCNGVVADAITDTARNRPVVVPSPN